MGLSPLVLRALRHRNAGGRDHPLGRRSLVVGAVTKEVRAAGHVKPGHSLEPTREIRPGTWIFCRLQKKWKKNETTMNKNQKLKKINENCFFWEIDLRANSSKRTKEILKRELARKDEETISKSMRPTPIELGKSLFKQGHAHFPFLDGAKEKVWLIPAPGGAW